MRNPNAPHIDFSDLSTILGKMLPSNVDMVLERKGHFLFGEWKRENEKVSLGQKILLKALSQLPFTEVLLIEGNSDDGLYVNKFWKIDGDVLKHRGTGTEAFKEYILVWLDKFR